MPEIPNTPRARKLIYLSAFLFFLLALGIIYLKDEPLQDRSDLALKLPPSDPKDNILPKLESSAAILALCQDKERNSLSSKLSREDTLIKVKPILEKHAVAMVELDSLLKTGAYFRSIPKPGASAVSTYMPALGITREVTNSLVQRANVLIASGKPEEALVLIAEGEAWINNSTAQTNSLIHYLVCVAIGGILNASKAKAIAACSDREILRKITSAPDRDQLWRDGLRQGYQGECLFFEDLLTEVQNKPSSQTELPKAFDFIPKRLVIKPNQTLNLETDLMRQLLPVCDAKDFTSAKAISVTFYEQIQRVAGEKGVMFFVRPNLGGRIFFKMMLPALENIAMKTFITIAKDRQIRTLAALRLYELDKGRLPEKLEELVPAYLDAVPLDPADSKPMRYLPLKRAVYSINRHGDLSDDGGDPSKDTVMRLDWDQE
ncbi:MAG: hypothetical protein RL095_928 [Verrucomicrobiota bacterium]|jgi:hypothetical protein